MLVQDHGQGMLICLEQKVHKTRRFECQIMLYVEYEGSSGSPPLLALAVIKQLSKEIKGLSEGHMY
uniref:Uncharacterized protein n=1 Tax=Arundo donax TaxID=35708 RepID=A0A0A8YDE9_ARUDO